jgi:AAT family amino acid transporter
MFIGIIQLLLYKSAPAMGNDIEEQPQTGEKEPVQHPHPTVDHEKGEVTPLQTNKLARRLSARQVSMIAIGGTIGTGLFLGTGKSLATGGPASMLLSYVICGGIIFVNMLCLGEMSAFIPVSGSFCSYAGYVGVDHDSKANSDILLGDL